MSEISGLIHVYEGEGKGKSTAAIGAAVRAIGAGMKVRFIHFFKNVTSENKILRKLENCDFVQFKELSPFFKEYTNAEFKELKQSFKAFWSENVVKKVTDKYDVLILDEISYCITSGLCTKNLLLKLLNIKPDKMEIIMTGRKFPSEIIDVADYVSEIKKVKHPFDEKIIARKGVEY